MFCKLFSRAFVSENTAQVRYIDTYLGDNRVHGQVGFSTYGFHLLAAINAQHLARELAAYKDGLVSDGEESVEANCFRARNNLERIAPGGSCSIAPASSAVYS